MYVQQPLRFLTILRSKYLYPPDRSSRRYACLGIVLLLLTLPRWFPASSGPFGSGHPFPWVRGLGVYGVRDIRFYYYF